MDWRLWHCLYFVLLIIVINNTYGQDYIDPGPEDCTKGITEALVCTNNAIQKARAFLCDWTKVIPDYQACTDMATFYCPYYVQEQWQERVREFNVTLQANTEPELCINPCINYVGKQNKFINCTLYENFGLNTTLNTIIAQQENNENYTESCIELEEIVKCIKESVIYCEPLINDADKTLKQPLAKQGEQICQTAYAIDKVIRKQNQQDNSNDDESQNQSKTNTRLIIIIVIICIIVIIIVNIVVICLCLRERKAKIIRRNKDWEDMTLASTVAPYTSPIPGGTYY